MPKLIITKIISGGQIGADQFALEVGEKLGIKTGGTAPPGFKTSIGNQSKLLKQFGLKEGEADIKIYPKRTIKNVQDSDGTIIFGNIYSYGSRLTIGTAKKNNKPYLINPTAKQIKKWIIDNNIKILNVAGNRSISSNQVKPILMNALGK